MFYVGFLFKKWAIRSSLFFGEPCERIAQVAHQKWAMWGNRSGCSRDSLRLLTIFSQKNERFAQKTDERIPSPGAMVPVTGLAIYFSSEQQWDS